MTIHRDGGKVTLTTEERIDTYNAPQFAADMEKALDGAASLTLDFSALDYISSSGLRAVMLAAKAMARQGELRIVGAGVRHPGNHRLHRHLRRGAGRRIKKFSTITASGQNPVYQQTDNQKEESPWKKRRSPN